MEQAGALLVDAFVVLGVVWPYYPQARSILSTRSADGFSTSVSLVVIVSATLRVFFWMGKRFELALLLQAVASIATQLAMMSVVVHVHRSKRVIAHATSTGSTLRTKRRSLLSCNWREFWQWDDVASYMQFQLLLVAALAGVTYALRKEAWFVETLGSLSLGIEALLPVPQAVQNYRKKSTHGLSGVLIGAWVAGDAFKTAYALVKGAPVQFTACGVFQLVVDLVILLQMQVLYRTKAAAPSPAGATLIHDAAAKGAAAQ